MIEAKRLSAGYDERPVLREVDFAARPGEVVALLGPNGAGKSTLLRCLSGVLAPASGEVLLDGEPLGTAKEVAKRVSFVPQSEDSVFEFTVYDLVAMGRYPWDDFDDGHVRWAMENAGCAELANRKITELSGGEKQRALFARALAQGGDVLLLDEPTAHMDVGYQIATLTLARELARENHTVVVAIHDLNLASGFADRAVLLHDGRIAAQGTVEEVLADPELERVYGASFERVHAPLTGRTVLVPEVVPERLKTANPLRIHIIGGGGSAGALLTELWQLGHTVSLGIASPDDSDVAAAERAGAPVILADGEIGSEDVKRALEVARQADLVIVAPAPYGTANLGNLALAYIAREAGVSVWAIEPSGEWDFTGGEAEQALQALFAAGAEPVSVEAARDRLA